MGNLEPEIGGGDFPTDGSDRNDDDAAGDGKRDHVFGAWHRINRALSGALPDGIARAQASARRIREGR